MHIHGHTITPTARSPLSSVPEKLSTVSATTLLELLDTGRVCTGHPDEQYEDLAKEKKGRFLSQGELVAFEGGGFMVELNGKKYTRTIRTSHCNIFIHGEKCESCSH